MRRFRIPSLFICSLLFTAVVSGCVEFPNKPKELSRVSLDPSVARVPNFKELAGKIIKTLGPEEVEPTASTKKSELGKQVADSIRPKSQPTTAVVREYDKQLMIAKVEILNPTKFTIKVFQRWRYDGRKWSDADDMPEALIPDDGPQPRLRRGLRDPNLVKRFRDLSKRVDQLALEAKKGVTEPSTSTNAVASTAPAPAPAPTRSPKR